MSHPRWGGTEREVRINGVEPDERLRIATSGEPQTWDTEVPPYLSHVDPADESVNCCRQCGKPCATVFCSGACIAAARVVNEAASELPALCDWCGDPLPEDTYKHCSLTCLLAARADSNDDQPVTKAIGVPQGPSGSLGDRLGQQQGNRATGGFLSQLKDRAHD